MTTPLFLTCGDSIKLWDSKDYCLVHQFHPNPSADELVIDASWSKKAGRIASVCNKRSSLVISALSASAVQSDIALKHVTDVSCCSFCSSSSRYVAVGCRSGQLLLWDNNSNKTVKQFKGHSATVTRLAFRRSDSHLASASRSGPVLLHNVTSGVMTQLNNATAQDQWVRDLRFSGRMSAHLGAAYNTGDVCVWDVNRSAPLHVFHDTHVAPATALAFSPVNTRFLASAGLDKRLICYDLKSQTVVQRQMCGAPVTALDFSADGQLLLVGTSRGRVEVYDLMNFGQPVGNFTAHGSSVQRLQFQPSKGWGSETSQQSESEYPLVSHRRSELLGSRQLPSEYEQMPSVSCADGTRSARLDSADTVAGRATHTAGSAAAAGNTTALSVTDSTAIDDVFSPVRGGSISDSSMARSMHSVGGVSRSVVSPPLGCRSAVEHSAMTGPDSANSLFSPVRRSILDASDVLSTSNVRGAGIATTDSGAAKPRRSAGRGASIAGPLFHSTPDEPARHSGVGTEKRRSMQISASPAQMSLPASDQPQTLLEQHTQPTSGGVVPTSSDGGVSEAGGDAQVAPPIDGSGGDAAVAPQPLGSDVTPHSLLESFQHLEEQVEDMRYDLKRSHFHTQWVTGRDLYEMKTQMKDLMNAMMTMQSDMTQMRQDIQQLAHNF